MAKKKQEDVSKPRYTIRCKKCNNIWDSEKLENCCKCGCSFLFADDHNKATSRYYLDGIQIDVLKLPKDFYEKLHEDKTA